MTDYLEKAVEAAREAEQRVRSTWPPPSPARVLTAILRAAEPFIAEHHRMEGRNEARAAEPSFPPWYGLALDVGMAAQKMLMSVKPPDGHTDPVTASRQSITDLRAALEKAAPTIEASVLARLKDRLDRVIADFEAGGDAERDNDEPGIASSVYYDCASKLRASLPDEGEQ